MGGEFIGHFLGTALWKGIQTLREGDRVAVATDPRNFSRVDPSLPIERWAGGGEFVFGVPWGWRDLTEDERRDVAGPIGVAPIAAVTALRTDRYSTSAFVVEVGDATANELLVNADQLAAAKVPQGLTSLGAPRRVLLGGERAILADYTMRAPGERFGRPGTVLLMISETVVVRRGRLYRFSFEGPRENHRRYTPVMSTMLGTWRWRQ